jgi:hypothetical protein
MMRKRAAFEIDGETNYDSLNDGEKNTPAHALIKESLMLSDNEVTLTFIKFMIGVAILNFPAQSAHHGIIDGFIATGLICAFILKSNQNLVKAIPLEMMN